MNYTEQDAKRWDVIIDATSEIPGWAKKQKREQLRAVVWTGEQLVKKGYAENEAKDIAKSFGLSHAFSTAERTWADAEKLVQEKLTK
jgi:hypothetical protein